MLKKFLTKTLNRTSRLGKILIAAGLINQETLDYALKEQRESLNGSKKQMGQILLDMGAVTHDQLDKAMQVQSRARGDYSNDPVQEALDGYDELDELHGTVCDMTQEVLKKRT